MRLRSGFTFLELLIVSAILIIAIAGLLMAFVNCILLNDANNELVVATGDAQYVLEQIKSLAYNDINTYVPPVFTNLRSENIPAPTITQVSAGVKEITVNVTWTDKRGRQRSVSLATRIARH